MAELVQIWEREILPHLDLTRLLANLAPKKVGGNVYVRCPHCGEHEAYIKSGHDTIKCNRANSCGEQTQLLSWLNNGSMPKGKQWVDTIRELGKTVGVTIPEKNYSQEQVEAYQTRKAKQTLLENVLDRCKASLQTCPAAIKYLTHERGFKPERLTACEFGYWPKGLVVDGAAAEIEALFGEDLTPWTDRVILPLRDRSGDLIGIAGRALDAQGPKFLKTHGYEIKTIGLEGLDIARKYKHILVGESTFGVFSFREAGFPEMAGIGGSYIDAERWEKIYSFGFESVTLCLDPDTAGREGTFKSIEAALDARNCPDIYVIPWSWLDGMDPDQYVRTKGADAWKLLMANRQPVDTYMAYVYAEKHDVKTSLGYQSFLDAVASYLDKRSKDPKRALHAWQHFFRDGVQKIIDIDEDYFFDYVVFAGAKRKEAEIKEQLADTQELFRKATKEFDLKTARVQLSKAVQTLEAVDLDKQMKALVRTSLRLPQHDMYLKEAQGKTTIGLVSRTYPTFDAATGGARGLIAVGGGPGAGKTTFAFDLATDILRHNLDTCMIMVSLEMSEEELLTRFKSRALSMPYDKLLLKSNEDEREEATALIQSICDRMFIIDEEVYSHVTVDLVIRDAARLKAETGCDRIIIVIDYLQLWPLPEDVEKKPEIEQDKWIVQQMKRLRRAFFPNPVIFISEVSKIDNFKASGLHSIKGSSRIVFAADIVALLNQVEEEDLLERIELAGLKFKLKNKPSRYKKQRKKNLSADEQETALEYILDEMEKQGKGFVDVSLPKVRGGKRKSFTLVHKHTCSDMKEITVNGEGAA